ncbi:hypothetical protein [Aeromicrobium sp.]
MSPRDEDGTAVIEFIWLALLLLIPVVYILIAVFDVQRAAYGASAASRSAARAFVLAPDVPTAFQRADRAASVALGDQDVSGASVSVTCTPTPADCLTPGSSVRVVVRMTQPLPLTPQALGDQITPITVDSTHVEPYGTYREPKP